MVNAHGQENAEAMLPLFESYLDKQVGAAGPVLLYLPSNVPAVAPAAQAAGCQATSPPSIYRPTNLHNQTPHLQCRRPWRG